MSAPTSSRYPSKDVKNYNLDFDTGLTIVMASAAADITVVFD